MLRPYINLPPVMCESPIGLRHPVRVFLLLDRLALALRREDHLGGEPLRHVLLAARAAELDQPAHPQGDRKSTRLNSSHVRISYAVFCLKKKNQAAASTSDTPPPHSRVQPRAAHPPPY